MRLYYRGDRKAGFQYGRSQCFNCHFSRLPSVSPFEFPPWEISKMYDLRIQNPIKMVRTPPANGLPKKAAGYADRRFLVVSAPFLLDKQNRQLRRTTRSVIRLQFAHPNRLGTSQVTPDTNLIAIQFFYCLQCQQSAPGAVQESLTARGRTKPRN